MLAMLKAKCFCDSEVISSANNIVYVILIYMLLFKTYIYYIYFAFKKRLANTNRLVRNVSFGFFFCDRPTDKSHKRPCLKPLSTLFEWLPNALPHGLRVGTVTDWTGWCTPTTNLKMQTNRNKHVSSRYDRFKKTMSFCLQRIIAVKQSSTNRVFWSGT